MIPTKIDPTTYTAIREKSVESIVDWFEQYKQSFYILGWFFLRNHQQLEDLFYRSIIKAHKALFRFNRKTSFETWVTFIFIHTCRELSENRSFQASEESEQHMDLIRALDQLKEYEREAMVLKYVKGFSQEDTAHLLEISVKKMKEHLFSGIQSLRKEMGYGSTFNGCKEYHQDYIDYLERTMDRSKKINFEIHLHHCQDCQEDLATFQDVILTMSNLTERMKGLHVPTGFIENVKVRLAEQEKHRQQKFKKRIRIGMVFASVFALLIGIGFFTGAFTNLYYSWTEDNQELRAFLQHDLGEKLNLEAKSNGVKIKIKGVVADDVQTLIFYEIEDTKGKNQYVMNPDFGVLVENQLEIMNRVTYPGYDPPNLKSDVNKKEKNVYQGKIGLPPLKKDNGTIKLKITKLLKLFHNSSDQIGLMTNNGDIVSKTGEWNFKIPVTKQPSTKYALNEKTEVEGIPVRFDKLTIAPTATILQYRINNEQPEKQINNLNLGNLEVNNKKMKVSFYGSSLLDAKPDTNWNTFQIHFDPLFEEKPKEVKVQFGSVNLTINDPKTIELNASQKYPLTFEYAGSTISIDKVEDGQMTNFVISNHEIKNRKYETLQLDIVNGNSPMGPVMNTDGVVVDKNGVKYGRLVPYQEIKQPRYFTTVQTIRLQSNNISGEKVIPKELRIYGYNTTKYLDDVVKIPLK